MGGWPWALAGAHSAPVSNAAGSNASRERMILPFLIVARPTKSREACRAALPAGLRGTVATSTAPVERQPKLTYCGRHSQIVRTASVAPVARMERSAIRGTLSPRRDSPRIALRSIAGEAAGRATADWLYRIAKK